MVEIGGMNIASQLSPWQDRMDEAIELAVQAGAAGDVPVGALVLASDGRVLGRGFNQREILGDPLAHAEIQAIRQAAKLTSDCGVHDVAGSHSHAGFEIEQLACETRNPNRNAREARWNLSDTTLVVTLEPCPMCAGAALAAHVGRIVFGSWDSKMGACGSVWDIPRDPHIGAMPEVIGGVKERECAELLNNFFQKLR